MNAPKNNIQGKVNLAGRLLQWLGWKPITTTHFEPRSVVCVAPHTSNLDFLIGYLYYKSLGTGITPRFLIKKEWFFFPFNLIFKALGGLPVDRKSGASSVEQAIEMLRKADQLHIAITPEGTRKARERWKTGFYRIAMEAGIPVQLAKIDYSKKEVGIFLTLPADNPNVDAAVLDIRKHYHSSMAKFPKNFVDL
ncbi:1-acyl-sn-glycerol-3-phosphate acyltransferase [Porphyromonas levii]|uniref:1-acyl-sn-glycerol-3-phosphate acyltransferase n=1 Tax=Porphyromonas levii TaxID=28114 RepID=UPI00035FAC77|nr:1-acyl-sn-glycerol-3-phosphate acyltransferase [Porphyromonas levii]